MNAAPHNPSANDNLNALCRALGSFLEEFGAQRDLCIRHKDTTAIHAKGKALGVYRMYGRDADAIKYLRDATASLPPWEKATKFDWEGSDWNRLKNEIDERTNRHKKLETVVSRGVAWKGHPVCIHAYKFEIDPVFKVELEMLDASEEKPEFALRTLADSLECHDFLLPQEVCTPKQPYEKHEATFLTIDEYLSRNLPPDMYALYAPQPPADSPRAT